MHTCTLIHEEKHTEISFVLLTCDKTINLVPIT